MEVVVVVEIPRGGRAKFEIDPVSGAVWLDRVLSTSTQYPTEYGFVVGTTSGDGDPLDAVVLLEEATVPGCHVRTRPIGVLDMVDEHGPDPKLLCVATGDPNLGGYHDVGDVPAHLLEEIEHFFRVYKQLEPQATVETSGWRGARAAEALVAASRSTPPPATAPPTTAPPTTAPPPPGGHDMDITIDDRERALLQELLDAAYRDLRYEIADTDRSEFKEALRTRAESVRHLLDAVGGPLPDRQSSAPA